MKWLTILPHALLALLAGSAVASQDIQERKDASPNGEIEVSNVSGKVLVTGWDQSSIEITGTLGEGVERLEFVREGDHTSIRVIHKENQRHTEPSYLTIRAPAGSLLDVTTVSADIEVSAMIDRQHLQTVSGDVIAEVFDAEIDGVSVSGDLQITGHGGQLVATLKAISGDIELMGVGGEVSATTISGDVEIRAEMLSRARLTTTNGDMDLQAGLAADGRLELSTTSGDVQVRIDQDVDLEVDVETLSGDISNCFGVDVTREKYGPGRTLRFQLGEASRTVRVRSLSGDVDVCSDTTSG
jgi:DUF4097 and DUF4098 domain-containing protein YvlB